MTDDVSEDACLQLRRLLNKLARDMDAESAVQVQQEFDSINSWDDGICICWQCNPSQTEINITKLKRASISAPFQCQDCDARIWPCDEDPCGIPLCQTVCKIFVSTWNHSFGSFCRLMARLHPLWNWLKLESCQYQMTSVKALN